MPVHTLPHPTQEATPPPAHSVHVDPRPAHPSEERPPAHVTWEDLLAWEKSRLVPHYVDWDAFVAWGGLPIPDGAFQGVLQRLRAARRASG